MQQYIRWFEEIDREAVPVVGGKGANLGEMTRAGLPVPPGFVVTVDAYRQIIGQGKLGTQIQDRLRGLDPDNDQALVQTASDLQKLVQDAPLPADVQTAVIAAYKALAEKAKPDQPFVAVRSSATVEDAGDTSFVGMFRSFLNVSGEAALLKSLRACWASLFTARSLAYRSRQNLLESQQIAVIVQLMINSEKSGVVFTVDPATANPNHLVIEGAWGLGEVVVSGQVTPDHYVVDKADLRILERVISHKAFMLVRMAQGENQRIELDDAKATERVLSDAEIQQIAQLALDDEAHYGVPQDAEWAIADGKVYLVQTRPVTAFRRPSPAKEEVSVEVLVHGLGASPGSGSGKVHVLRTVAEAAKFQHGEVLVAEMTSPDWVPTMRRAAAIITDGGGMTSHAAIVSRELGVPCVVGTGRATRILHDGDVVTVDGREGTVRRGVAPVAPTVAQTAPAQAVTAPSVTATRLYVNLAEPDRAEAIARLPVDGVGLLRAEFMIVSALGGIHPRQLLETGKSDEFVRRMATDLRRFASAFDPRPVIYRSTDFKTNEFRGLVGGDRYETVESNPMLGYRGCYRNIKEPDLFGLELRAVAQVRAEFSNLHLMIPFVRTASEFAECKRLVDASGLTRDKSFQLWVMAEIPSVVYWLPTYAGLGATGVSIGSNDLTQLVLGVDRDSEIVAPLYDERDPAVLDVIQKIIEQAHAVGMTCSICGQAPSVYPEYAELLVRWGIDSISVSADVVEVTRHNIATAEQRLLLAAARQQLPELPRLALGGREPTPEVKVVSDAYAPAGTIERLVLTHNGKA